MESARDEGRHRNRRFQQNQHQNHPRSYGPEKSVEGWVLFVTSVHEEAQEEDLVDWFGGYGEVKRVKMMFDRLTGHGKGYALVEFDRQEEAQNAINGLAGTQVMGRTIGVSWAFVKPPGHAVSRRMR
jgi:RNA-binding protein 8A